VSLEFRCGKAVEAVSGNNSRRLNEILDQDNGARFVGEFAFGLHPLISNPINDILFDEKIAGSVHLALGNAYGMCDNGNRSAIHWDLILLQTAAMGGGSVFLDDVLIRADGRFVLPELASLNPENLH
jgi:aminopeptidase